MNRIVLWTATALGVAAGALFATAPGQAQETPGPVYLPIVSQSRIIDPDATATQTPTPTSAPSGSSQQSTPIASPTATGSISGTLPATLTPDANVTLTGSLEPVETPTPTATATDESPSCVVYGEDLARSSHFGVQMYEDTRAESKYFQSLVNSRAGWVRVIAPWSQSEPKNTTPENYDWARVDRELAVARHLDINVIATFGFAPGWAATNPNGELDKTDLGELVEYVTALVERYDGDGVDDAPCSPRVDYWEFYNEPDRAARQNAGYFRNSWGEVPNKYANMLAAVYPAIKSANPEALVLFGGIAYEAFDKQFVEDFTARVLQAGGGDYFDIMAFHIYPEFWYVHAASPPGLYEKTQKIRRILADNGVDKPLFITETGSFSKSVGSFKMTEETQARYVPQLLVQSLAADVDTVIWFMLYDMPDTFYPYKTGLVTSDEPPQRKLAFGAFHTAINILDTAEYIRAWSAEERGRDDLYVYELRNTDNDRLFWVAWLSPVSTKEKTEIKFKAEYVTRRDLYGIGVIVVDAADGTDDGYVTIEVTGQPTYIELP